MADSRSRLRGRPGVHVQRLSWSEMPRVSSAGAASSSMNLSDESSESVDGGNTWNITNFNPDNLGWGGLGTNNRIHKIMYHPTIEDLVFVGTSEGIYRSEDSFNTFAPAQVENIFNISGSYDFIEFHPENENIVYLANKNNYQNI